MAACFLAADSAHCAAAQTPHPAVVRVVAPGRGSVSYGSGTLIAVGERHGLVITNWHVINEATGQIGVLFPDGFRSGATVKAVDRDWDLAALAIWRPNVKPVTIASAPPKPGEVLTIAGYGSGNYRAVSGRCTQYVAPGQRFPFEMVELAASARQGDSGGPIFNQQGELAGVLFGEGRGRTAGSYCGRVQWFLASVAPRGGAFDTPIQVADSRAAAAAAASQFETPEPADKIGLPVDEVFAPRAPDTIAATKQSTAPKAEADGAAALAQVGTARPFHPAAPAQGGLRHIVGWREIAGETMGQQLKTVLAGVGLLFVFLRTISWLGREPA